MFVVANKIISCYSKLMNSYINRARTKFLYDNSAFGSRTGFPIIPRRSISVSSLFGSGSNMPGPASWLHCNEFTIHPWSISGLESAITINAPKLKLTFDMGYVTRESVNSDHVFISHGHIDHVSAILAHAARRELYSRPQSTYHVPSHLVGPLHTVADGIAGMHGYDQKFTQLKINPLNPGETFELSKTWSIRPFPTRHRVASQGYILYKTTQIPKPQYQGLSGRDIGKAVRERGKKNVFMYRELPQLAYTGDTTFELFSNPPTPDLLNCPVIITECTYLDDEYDRHGRDCVSKAIDRGHSHLRQFVENEHLFSNVEHLVFVHMSDKYSAQYINKCAKRLLTRSLSEKVQFGLNMWYQR